MRSLARPGSVPRATPCRPDAGARASARAGLVQRLLGRCGRARMGTLVCPRLGREFFDRRAVRDEDDIDAPNAGNRAWYGGALTPDLFSVDDGARRDAGRRDRRARWVGYAHGVRHGVPSGLRGIGWVNVLPEARRSGAGAALWQAVLGVRTPDRVKGVTVQAGDSDTETIDIALARGFRRRGLAPGERAGPGHHRGAPGPADRRPCAGNAAAGDARRRGGGRLARLRRGLPPADARHPRTWPKVATRCRTTGCGPS